MFQWHAPEPYRCREWTDLRQARRARGEGPQARAAQTSGLSTVRFSFLGQPEFLSQIYSAVGRLADFARGVIKGNPLDEDHYRLPADAAIPAGARTRQVADAIRAYYSVQQRRVGNGDAALPTSMDQLLEGLPGGTRKRQILRPSAARDPLSESGEWRLVRPRSLEISDFVQALMLYAENVGHKPTTRNSSR